MLKIIPLGGLGEIGLNMMVFEYGETLFIVDAGLMFPEDYMLGVDYVIPDMNYIKHNRRRITGIIRSKIRTALRQYFYFTIGRRPVIMPFIMVI